MKHVGFWLLPIATLTCLVAHPSVRRPLRVQLLGSEWLPWRMSLWPRKQAKPSETWARLAARHPDDARVLAKAGEEPDNRMRTIAHYDRLIPRFPDRVWLVANRLRFTPPFPSVPPSRSVRPYFGPFLASPPEVEKALTLARRGRELDSDNAFFDAMLTYFLFVAGREQEALDALHTSSRKARFDSYLHDDLLNCSSAFELAGSLLLEEKMEISAQLSYGHSWKLFDVAAMAVRCDVSVERAGRHAHALRIYEEVERLGSRIRTDAFSSAEAHTGVAIQILAWRRRYPFVERRQGRAGYDLEKIARNYAETFARSARSQGRKDLAQRTLHEAVEIRKMLARERKANAPYMGLTGPEVTRLLDVWWTQLTLLPVAATHGFLWLALCSLIAARRMREAPIPILHSLVGILACLLVATSVGIALVFSLRAGAGKTLLFLANYRSVADSDSSQELYRTLTTLRWLIALLPALIIALLCQATLSMRTRAIRRLAPLRFGISFWANAGLTACATGSMLVWLIFPDVMWLPALSLYTCLARWAIKTAWRAVSRRETPVVIEPREFAPPGDSSEERAAAGVTLCLYRQLLGTLTVVAVFAYLILAFDVSPQRQWAEERIDLYIQSGDSTLR